jgi:hypothetical protein
LICRINSHRNFSYGIRCSRFHRIGLEL